MFVIGQMGLKVLFPYTGNFLCCDVLFQYTCTGQLNDLENNMSELMDEMQKKIFLHKVLTNYKASGIKKYLQTAV